MSKDNFQASISGSFLMLLLVFSIGLIIGLTIKSPWGLSSGEFSALSITILAFIVSSYHFYSIRKHNRLSVKPHLQIEDIYNFDKDKKIFSYQLMLHNYGLGPAVIKEEKLFIDNIHVKNKDDYYKSWASLVVEVLKLNSSDSNMPDLSIGYIDSYDAMDKGSSKILMAVNYPVDDSLDILSEKEKMQVIISRSNISIDYECHYGNCFHFVRKKNS
ncbi:hypothetical protein IMCC1989_2756 [gamma proteobacterium IMCC1989]|nr:hypothetical protein IMCC1989_2756 [gamma proteobacterium IMCC1989]